MKIGIITAHVWNNYGSLFQAYALSVFLRKHHNSVEIIDYHQISDSSKISTLYKSVRSDGIVKTLIIVINIIKSTLIHRLNKQHFNKLSYECNLFRQRYLPLSGKKYTSSDQLKQISSKYDAYIVGSDNIWLFIQVTDSIPVHMKPYLLDFVDSNKLKIAYAPSMGEPNLPDGKHDNIIHYLNSFDALSVRGLSTVRLIESLPNTNPVFNALDPTFLLSEANWDKDFPEITTSPEKLPYILIYSIYPRPSKEPIFIFSKKLAKKLGLNIIHIGHYKKYGFSHYNDVSVTEFIRYIKNASVILTNSFHGTCFSIIFRKPFYSFMPGPIHSKTRITDLLSLFQLSDRFVDSVELAEKVPLNIDYHQVNTIIDYECSASKEWLLQALSIDKSRDV